MAGAGQKQNGQIENDENLTIAAAQRTIRRTAVNFRGAE